ncbi:MAG: hypothetical protein H3C41_01750 [Bacteroidales bacterium]|nr:hypothetical protein [Bacteroidales bacterium]
MTEFVFTGIIQAVCRHFGIVCDQLDQKTSLEQIGQHDSKLVSLLAACQQAQSTARFLLSDYELRHKMPDIWQAHCIQSQADSERAQADLVNYCLENEIAAQEILQFEKEHHSTLRKPNEI